MDISNIIPGSLSIEQCKKLPTPRLLKYYRKYRGYRHIGKCSCCRGAIPYGSDVKANDIANEYLDGVKAILDSREHVK